MRSRSAALRAFFQTLFGAAILSACGQTPAPSGSPEVAAEMPAGGYCAAIQGNGDAIFGHFHSLARMIDQFGPPSAAAGSSSATITMFLYESMLLNPLIADCRCDAKEKARRLSLLMKSLVGYHELKAQSKEAAVLQNYSEIAAMLKPEAIRTALADPSGAGVRALREKIDELTHRDHGKLLRDLGVLYNRRFGELFAKSPDLHYHVEDFYRALTGGFWKIDSPKVFLRPFPISFDGVATVIGRIGDFYAGRGYDAEKWKGWLQRCGPLAKLKDKSWGQIAYADYTPEKRAAFLAAGIATARQTDCGAAYRTLVEDYDRNPPTGFVSRMEEPVGAYFRALPITGLILGAGARAMEKAKRDHWAAVRNPELKIDWSHDYRIGVFGQAEDLDAVTRSVDQGVREGTLRNLKAQKFTALKGYTWRMAMNTSPAEPSIAEAKEMKPDLVSIGGWVDPQPATLLKHAGCRNIVFITAAIEKADLVTSLNSLIGGGDYNDRLTARQPIDGFGPSALMEGLQDSGAVWCTDWHKYRGTGLKEVYDMTESTFRAAFEARNVFFRTAGLPWVPSVGKPSCSPGV